MSKDEKDTLKGWSEKYYKDIDPWQHDYNNAWFKQMLTKLKTDGILVVPSLGKTFDKKGKEIRATLNEEEE